MSWGTEAQSQLDLNLCREILDEYQAQLFDALDSVVVPMQGVGAEELHRAWVLNIPDHWSQVRRYLEIYASAKNTSPQRTVTDPIASTEVHKGIYRQVAVRRVQRNGINYVVQTLRRGLARELNWKEAYVVERVDAPANNQTALTAAQTDNPYVMVEVEIPAVDPAYEEDVIQSILAAPLVTNLEICDEVLDGDLRVLSVRARKVDDGSLTLRIVLARPTYVIRAFERLATPEESDTYYVFDVPDSIAQQVVDVFRGYSEAGAYIRVEHNSAQRTTSLIYRRRVNNNVVEEKRKIIASCRMLAESTTRRGLLTEPSPPSPPSAPGERIEWSASLDNEGLWTETLARYYAMNLQARRWRITKKTTVEETVNSGLPPTSLLPTPNPSSVNPGETLEIEQRETEACSWSQMVRKTIQGPLEEEEYQEDHTSKSRRNAIANVTSPPSSLGWQETPNDNEMLVRLERELENGTKEYAIRKGEAIYRDKEFTFQTIGGSGKVRILSGATEGQLQSALGAIQSASASVSASVSFSPYKNRYNAVLVRTPVRSGGGGGSSWGLQEYDETYTITVNGRNYEIRMIVDVDIDDAKQAFAGYNVTGPGLPAPGLHKIPGGWMGIGVKDAGSAL